MCECIFECFYKRHMLCVSSAMLPRGEWGGGGGMYLQAATSFIANGILIELTCRVHEAAASGRAQL